MKKLFLLRPIPGKGVTGARWDIYLGFVVRAGSAAEARALVPCGDECDRKEEDDHASSCVWRNEHVTSCELIGVALPDETKSMIVISSFNAG